MKFRLLLYIIHRKLKKAATANDRFKSFIQSKKLSITIKTGDSRLGRRYTFENGKISSTSGIAKECDAAMVWRDANTAFEVMSSGNEEASVAALTEQKLQIEGSFKEFMWFSRALDIMMGKA
ncbi:hypothetical protein KJ966_08895 [bacterium]|nr:hypothetical protein [bacterium]